MRMRGVYKDYKKQTWHRYSDHFICSMLLLSEPFFFKNDTVY